MSPTNSIEVELDSRRRLPMAKIVHGSQQRFRVTTLASGEILLTPVVSISERELAMLRSPAAIKSLMEGVDQATTGEVVRYEPGHFTRLAEELGDDTDE